MQLNELLSLLKPEIEQIDQAMATDMETIGDAMLREILTYSLFNGGKRIRPLLCILAARLCGNRSRDIYRFSMAFEYLHGATLLHDDVIDHADHRRGRPATNQVWGTTPAILAGDYLHARSMHLIGSLGGGSCLKIICLATAAMVEGEFLQFHNSRNFNQSENDYFTVVNGKTALLIAAVCEAGAVFAGASDKKLRALRSYGLNLGTAFQIVDDLLDYLGEPAKTGKAIGNDFCEGKMTLPLIHGLRNATESDRDFLLGLLSGSAEQRRCHIDRVCKLIASHDGFEVSRQKAKQYTEAALDELKNFDDPSTAGIVQVLAGLAHYVLHREK